MRSQIIYYQKVISKNKVINIYTTVQITVQKLKLSAFFYIPHISAYGIKNFQVRGQVRSHNFSRAEANPL